MKPNALKQCQLSEFHNLSKGTVVYKQGDHAKEFYYIKQGLIGLYHRLDNGKENLVRLYQQGEYFGFRTVFGDSCYHCTAKVLVETELARIKPEGIHQFFIANPEISEILLKTLANELRDAEERLAKSAYSKTLDRVIDSICFLTENFPYYNWTYREIAEYAGCETETAIRISRELKRMGLFSDVLNVKK